MKKMKMKNMKKVMENMMKMKTKEMKKTNEGVSFTFSRQSPLRKTGFAGCSPPPPNPG